MLKVAFFQKVRFVFQISKSPKKISPNHYPELEIWISCLLLGTGISNFKFRIVIWSNCFLEIWKTNLTFWKKPPLFLLVKNWKLRVWCSLFHFLVSSILPKNMTKKLNPTMYFDTSGWLVFVRFLEEIEDTKRTFRNQLTFKLFRVWEIELFEFTINIIIFTKKCSKPCLQAKLHRCIALESTTEMARTFCLLFSFCFLGGASFRLVALTPWLSEGLKTWGGGGE